MPTDMVVLGENIVANFNIGTTSGTGEDGAGQITISNGTAVFEADDVIVFTWEGLDPDGQVIASSTITSVTVYDSASDYNNGITKYTYSPQNPNSAGTPQTDLSGLGDTYVRINNMNQFLPDDGAPAIPGSILIGSGIDFTNQPITIDRHTDLDFNQDGTLPNSNLEDGDGAFYVSGNNTLFPVCFTAGTLIPTDTGLRPVEDLGVGDIVMTASNGPKSITWIGSKTVEAKGTFAPVRITAGSYGNAADIEFSQQHRVLLRGGYLEMLYGEPEMLAAARHLVDGDKVLLRQAGSVTYVHFTLDEHQLIETDGIVSESFYPGEMARGQLSQDAQKELQALFTELFKRATMWPLIRPELKGNEAKLFCSIAHPFHQSATVH